jgi:glycosyltransferase involved in cell wall biosynthesis
MRVSAIVPVFNGAAMVGDGIRSVLGQRFNGESEIVVVNDGSTDSTLEVLTSFGSQIRVVSQPNRGLAAARNAGAAAASGEFLAFLDADDTWRPDKLATTVACLDASPSAVLAYSDILPVDARGQSGHSPITPELAHAPSMDELLERWWPILPSTVVMRRDTFVQADGFCEQFRRAYEDVDMWLRARELGDFEYLAAPLVRYRTSPIADRMERYEGDYAIFRARVLGRYGSTGRQLLRATQDAYIASLGHRGLIAMRAGDTHAARSFFIRALRHKPLHPKTILRLLRTFLPRSIALALGGRSREQVDQGT